MQNYGERAKEWITDHDLKQKRLAIEFGITPSAISNYVTGRSMMPVDILVKMSEKFGVSVDYLVGMTDDPGLPIALSQSERQLIENFRTLSREQKELILKNIAFMQEQNRKE